MNIRKIKSLPFLLILSIVYCSHLKEAHNAYKAQNYKQTIHLCRQAIAQDSSDGDAYELMGCSYLALDSLYPALNNLLLAKEYKGESSGLSSTIATVYIKLGDRSVKQKVYKKALDHYLNAENSKKPEDNLLVKIADTYFTAGLLDKAKERYQQLLQSASHAVHASAQIESIKTRTETSWSFLIKGKNAYKTQELKTAKTWLQKALKEKSDNTEAHYLYLLTEGRLLYKKGSRSACWDAIELFGQAAILKPGFSEPYYWMALTYEKKDSDEFVNAIEAFETALKLEPNGYFSKTCRTELDELKKRKEKMDKFWGKKK